MRVYVAGPYTDGDPEENTKNAIEAGNQLLELGYIPFIPHLSHYWDKLYPQPIQTWYTYDIEWLRLSDAVLRIPGHSRGASREVELATLLHIPVYFSIEELVASTPRMGVKR